MNVKEKNNLHNEEKPQSKNLVNQNYIKETKYETINVGNIEKKGKDTDQRIPENVELSRILANKDDKEFLEKLICLFDLNKNTIESINNNIEFYKNTDESIRKLFNARLTYILENTAPLSYFSPMLTAFFTVINVLGLFISSSLNDSTSGYTITLIINLIFLSLFIFVYKKDREKIAGIKYLLELLKN